MLSMGYGEYLGDGSEVLATGLIFSGGDSGGATFALNDSDDLADQPLLGINTPASRCIATPSGQRCGAVSARLDDLGSWLVALSNF